MPRTYIIIIITPVMDKLSDHEFVFTSFMLRGKRTPYCLDKCFKEFDKEITDAQHACIRTCVKLHEGGLQILRHK